MTAEGSQKVLAEIAALLGTEAPVQKFVHHDDQWDFTERRAEEIKILRQRLADRRSGVAISDRILALEGQPGFQQFVAELEKRREAKRHELETSSGSDGQLRVLQGRCQELGALISLMRNLRENREALATEVSRLEDELAAYEKQPSKSEIPT